MVNAVVAEPIQGGEQRALLALAIRRAGPLKATPGETWLKAKGIEGDAGDACALRYHDDWQGAGPATLFPVRDGKGRLTAAYGRLLRPMAGLEWLTEGNDASGVFSTPGSLAMRSDGLDSPLAITADPLSAVALAVCGLPSLALFGLNHRPEWLPARLAGGGYRARSRLR